MTLLTDLDFSEKARSENIRRISEMVNLFLDAGVISLTAFISPLEKDRAKVKDLLGRENIIEIYCKCPLEVCEQRDVKGLYKKARAGLIKNYTGISSPYEEPVDADLVLETGNGQPIKECVRIILNFLRKKQVVPEGLSRKI